MNKMVHSLWYGIGTFVSAVMIISLTVFSFLCTFTMILTGHEETFPAPLGIALLLFALLEAALCWFYTITMIIDAARHYQGKTMVLWILLIYMCNVFVFPVYWLVCIRKRTDE